MNIRTQLRTLATASMVALAVVIVPAGLAHAEAPKTVAEAGCTAAGYAWSDTQGCANEPCIHDVFGNGLPGDTITSPYTGSRMYCDGYSGKWVVAVEPEAPRSGPAAPVGGGSVAPTGPTSSGPVAPRVTTSSR